MNYRAGRLEEISPESREVFADGISACLAGQQRWIIDETSGAIACAGEATGRILAAGCLADSAQGLAGGLPVDRPGRGGRGRRASPGFPAAGAGRSGRGVLPEPRAGLGPEVRGDRPRRGRTFAGCVRAAGVSPIIYLGGLRPPDSRGLSPHLRSRAEVGDILLGSGLPTAVLRAGVVIGSGSASFEMLRYLTVRLPVIVTPKWVRSRTQPIAIQDVLYTLAGCARLPAEVNRAFDIGGPDVLTYAEMMRRYATVAGLRPRLLLPTGCAQPVAVQPLGRAGHPGARCLAPPAGGIPASRRSRGRARHRPVRARPTRRADRFDESGRLALQKIRDADVATHWSSASLPGAPSDPLPTDPDWAGGNLYHDLREQPVDAAADALWRVIEGIGGSTGGTPSRFAWAVRGWLDRAAGGAGLRRGRRDPDHLRAATRSAFGG